MVHRLWLVCLFVVVLSLLGCQNDRVLLYVRDITPTPRVTQEPAAFTFTPTASFSPTATRIPPTPTAVPPSPTATPIPLSAMGPWLLYRNVEDPLAIIRVSNSDGTGEQTIEFPPDQEIVRWEHDRQYFTVLTSTPTYQTTLWVFALPDVTPLAKIDVLSEVARTAIENNTYAEGTPLGLKIRNTVSSPKWSPTDCQFTFSAREELYIFDCETGKVNSAIAEGHMGAYSLGWSPNGEWIAYFRKDAASPVDGPAPGYTPYYFGYSWLYNVKTEARILIQTDAPQYGYFGKWLSNTDFVSTPLYSEGDYVELSKYNLTTQQNTLLFDGMVLTNFFTASGGSREVIEVYEFASATNNSACTSWVIVDFATGDCLVLPVEPRWNAYWQAPVELWSTTNENGEWYLFNERGEIVHQYATTGHHINMVVSPDQQFVFFGSRNSFTPTLLFTVDGELITKLGMGYTPEAVWLENGKSLLVTEVIGRGLARFSRYSEDNGWQRETVFESVLRSADVVMP